MSINRTFSARTLLLFFLFFLFFLGIGYKLLEWKTLASLSQLNSKSVPEELTIVERTNKNQNETIELITEWASKENLPLEKKLESLDKIDGKINLAISYSNEYLNSLEKNRKDYKRLEFATKVLFGERGKFVRNFLSNQIGYYNEETEGAKEGIVGDYLVKNIFAVIRDKDIMLDFDKRASVAPKTYYPKYFPDIAPLEKYTRSDFKFAEEDRIKELFTYGHETLTNNKNYMAAYYSVVKDFVVGDYESAAYKYSRLEEEFLKLNIDFDRLFSEGENRDKERTKKVIEYVVNKNSAIKEFESRKFGVYPLLSKIEGWKDDLELCQLYVYKSEFYNDVLKKYPEAKDFESLVEELSQLPPSTTSVDSDFDRETIKFTNTDEVLQVECTDKEQNKTYTFKIIK